MLEAIVLSRRSFKEYDEILSLYSKEMGKVEVTARGIKKITSKNSSFLEPFSVVHAGTAPGKDRTYLTTTQVIEYFSGIRTDLPKVRQAALVVAWLEKVLSIGQRDTRIYETLLSWLDFVNGSQETKPILLDAFFFKILAFLGFEPQLQECIYCGKAVESEKQIWFSFLGGGVMCSKDKIEKKEELIAPLSLATILALRYILNRSWREITAFDTKTLYPSLHSLVYKYILSSTEKPLPDWP